MFGTRPGIIEFFKDGKYHLEGEGKVLDGDGIVRYYEALCARFPIASIEDGCAEDDWDTWKLMTDRMGSKIQLVGDDIFVTNPERLRLQHRARLGQRGPDQAQSDRHLDRNPGHD